MKISYLVSVAAIVSVAIAGGALADSQSVDCKATAGPIVVECSSTHGTCAAAGVRTASGDEGAGCLAADY